MDIIEQINERLSELDLGDKQSEIIDIIRDETKDVARMLAGKFELVAESLDTDKINIMYVDTGMLPRARGERYMKAFAKEFNEIKPDDAKMFYIADNTPGERKTSRITKLDRDSKYVIQLYTGSMPPEQVNRYIAEQREFILGNGRFDDYDIDIIAMNDKMQLIECEKDENKTIYNSNINWIYRLFGFFNKK